MMLIFFLILSLSNLIHSIPPSTQVVLRMAKFSVVYLPVFIGFALCFRVTFDKSGNIFQTPLSSGIKALAMMSGELDYNKVLGQHEPILPGEVVCVLILLSLSVFLHHWFVSAHPCMQSIAHTHTHMRTCILVHVCTYACVFANFIPTSMHRIPNLTLRNPIIRTQSFFGAANNYYSP